MFEIGSIKNGEINREWYGQGFVFKSWKNWASGIPNLPVYVPELSDTIYTRQDFIDIAGDKAEELFRAVDWQHPESAWDDLFEEENG